MRRLSLLHTFVHPGIGMLFYWQNVRIFAFLHRKVMDRGERIDSLLDKTSALKAESVGSSGMSGGDVGILSVFRWWDVSCFTCVSFSYIPGKCMNMKLSFFRMPFPKNGWIVESGAFLKLQWPKPPRFERFQANEDERGNIGEVCSEMFSLEGSYIYPGSPRDQTKWLVFRMIHVWDSHGFPTTAQSFVLGLPGIYIWEYDSNMTFFLDSWAISLEMTQMMDPLFSIWNELKPSSSTYGEYSAPMGWEGWLAGLACAACAACGVPSSQRCHLWFHPLSQSKFLKHPHFRQKWFGQKEEPVDLAWACVIHHPTVHQREPLQSHNKSNADCE